MEGVQPRPPAQGEHSILAALRARFSRPPPEKEAVAKLIEKVHQLEAQVLHLGKVQTRLEAVQRETAEHVDRVLEGENRLQKKNRAPSTVAPALAAGVLASAAVIAGGWALGMFATPAPLRGLVQGRSAPPPPAEPAAPIPAPAPVTPDASVAGASADAGAVAVAPEDARAVAEAADGGAADAGALAVADAGASEPPPVKPPPRRRTGEVTQAALLHAVAVSQVRRGESALEKGRADEALEAFRAALENEPTNAVAFRGLGMAYAMQGNDPQALQAYDKYLRLAPTAPDKGEIRRSIAELKARSKIGAGEK